MFVNKLSSLAVSDLDIIIISNMLLIDTFGDQGCNRVEDLIEQCSSGNETAETNWETTRATTWAALQIESICQELESHGQADLASFAADWVEDEKHDALRNDTAAISRVRRILHRISLCEHWEGLVANAQMSDEVSDFLAKQKFPARKRDRLESRLAQFFTKKLLLSDSEIFSRLYLPKSLVILTDTFGPGVAAFLSLRIQTSFRKIDSDSMTKEKKFKIAAQFLASNVPAIKQICDAIEDKLLGPLLRGERLTYVTGPAGRGGSDRLTPKSRAERYMAQLLRFRIADVDDEDDGPIELD